LNVTLAFFLLTLTVPDTGMMTPFTKNYKVINCKAITAQTSNFWRRQIFLHDLFSQIVTILGKKWRMTCEQNQSNTAMCSS